MKIIIPGNPIAKKRPRFTRRGKFVTTYNCQETEESRWLYEAQKQIKDQKLEGAIGIEFKFFFQRPNSHYGTGKNKGKIKANAPILHTKKPDIDNCIKFCLDCLNSVWRDDSAVWCLRAEKTYDDNPRTEINIGG